MTTIGVYDSGVGGLTTLRQLEKTFPFCDFYYLADNKNMPFGSKTTDDLKEIVASGLKKLKAHSDIPVFACNTASTLPFDVFKLSPPPVNDGKTLVMATPRTIETLRRDPNFQDERYSFFAGEELASLVETLAAVSVRKACLNMKEATPYLAKRVFEFKGVENVVLGCSHYLLLKQEIAHILGGVKFFDGNENLIKSLTFALADEYKPQKHKPKITFDFTADDETRKYSTLYDLIKSSENF